MFSIFDAMLQDRLECIDGFREAADILDSEGEKALKERFINLQLAINVLKHGPGRSYTALLEKAEDLPFRIKQPGENFFSEGDIAEISTLIEVNDAFVLNCAETIREVTAAIQRSRPEFIA